MPNTNGVRRPAIEWRAVSSLRLDPQNPRISVPESASQEYILRVLFETQALDELAMSLSTNGYFSEEPVVVVPHSEEADAFVVIEGNRRLATLQILLSSHLRRLVGANHWPRPSEQEFEGLTRIPTVCYTTREEVVPYLGFRHITGVKTWDPFAKARYVTGLVESGVPFEDVERSIGDTARTVKKLYQSFVVLTQIENDLDLNTDALRANFSLLEVALSSQQIKSHLGLPRQLPSQLVDVLVPDDHLQHLRELVSWIFGIAEEQEQRIISDSRQIGQRLAPILANPQALDHLRRTRDLDRAYEYSGGEHEYLLRQLRRARTASQNALGVLPLYREDDDVVGEIERLRTVVVDLARMIER